MVITMETIMVIIMAISKILTYVCDIIGAPKEMYCAINLAVEWRTSI